MVAMLSIKKRNELLLKIEAHKEAMTGEQFLDLIDKAVEAEDMEMVRELTRAAFKSKSLARQAVARAAENYLHAAKDGNKTQMEFFQTQILNLVPTIRKEG